MADRSVTVRISAQDNFSSVIDRYNRAMGQAEQQTRRVGQAADQQQGSWNRLGTAIGGAIAAIGIQQVISFAEDFNELGTQVDITERTFAQLAGTLGDSSDLLTRLQGATGGIVDDMTLMSGASRLLSMGLAENSDEVARLTELAVRLGGAMGNDAGASIENFSLLLANESILRLDSFGISSARVRQRIDELLESGEALNRSEAFRLAVLEEGGNSLDRLGSAAAAAETPLARLQTRLDNIFQQGAQNFATGVNAIVGGIEAITAATEGRRSRGEMINDILLAAGVTAPNRLDQAFGLPPIFSDEQRAAAEHVLNVTTRLNDITREGARWMVEQARAANQRVDAAEAAARVEPRINAARFVIEGQGGNLSRLFSQFGGTTGFDTFGELTADIEFFDPAALGQVSNQILNINAALENARALNEEGILSDDQLANFERAAERANAIAQAAVQGAEAFERMSLSQAFGTDGGGMLGEITDALVRQARERGYEDEQLEGLQRALDIASGRETQSSLAFEEQVLPFLTDIFSQLGEDAATQAAQNFAIGVQNARLLGVSDDVIAENITGFTGFGQSGLASDVTFTITPFIDTTTFQDTLIQETSNLPEIAAETLSEQLGVEFSPEMLVSLQNVQVDTDISPEDIRPQIESALTRQVMDQINSGGITLITQENLENDPSFQQAVDAAVSNTLNQIARQPSQIHTGGVSTLSAAQAAIQAQYGLNVSLPELLSATGVSDPRLVQPGTYSLAGGVMQLEGFDPVAFAQGLSEASENTLNVSDALGELPTGVDKAIESAGELQTVLDEMAAREYTIKLHIDDSEIAAAEGRLSAMGATINTQVGRVVRDNGGRVPGADNRGRGTRTMTAN
jgi:hypothetical protein